jgi:hypothetical protein
MELDETSVQELAATEQISSAELVSALAAAEPFSEPASSAAALYSVAAVPFGAVDNSLAYNSSAQYSLMRSAVVSVYSVAEAILFAL